MSAPTPIAMAFVPLSPLSPEGVVLVFGICGAVVVVGAPAGDRGRPGLNGLVAGLTGDWPAATAPGASARAAITMTADTPPRTKPSIPTTSPARAAAPSPGSWGRPCKAARARHPLRGRRS